MGTIEIVQGDITTQTVDAIVNAANSTLLGGGGVDGAIHRVAGPELLVECKAIGGCVTGEARITKGYRLPSKYIIHTVGPVWKGGRSGERESLASCYRNSLTLAQQHDCQTVALPAISCGAYGYPLDQAARVSIQAVHDWMEVNERPLSCRWVLFGDEIYKIWHQIWKVFWLQ